MLRIIYTNELCAIARGTKYGEKFEYIVQSWEGREAHLFICRGTPFKFVVFPTNKLDRFLYSKTKYANDFHQESITKERDFKAVKKSFVTWIEEDIEPYLEDVQQPDLWQTLTKAAIGNVLSIDYEDKSSFTLEEIQKVRFALDSLEVRMATALALNSSEIAAVKNVLDHVRMKLEHSNKLDWKLFFLGTIVNLIVVLTLDTERGNQLFRIIKEIFHSMWLLPNPIVV